MADAEPARRVVSRRILELAPGGGAHSPWSPCILDIQDATITHTRKEALGRAEAICPVRSSLGTGSMVGRGLLCAEICR